MSQRQEIQLEGCFAMIVAMTLIMIGGSLWSIAFALYAIASALR